MKTLAKACKPRDSIFDKARRDTVLDLSDLTQDRIDAAAFFSENHTTEGMRILLTEGFRRLEGKTTQGVFKLTQAMGGGKTHSLVAFGLLAKHPEHRVPVMDGFYTPGDLGPVRVVAFSGRESDTPLGIWGAIATQLGKKGQFADYYTPLSAPGQTAWINLLKGDPLLILLDELPPYFEYARSKTIGNSDLSVVTATALSNLLVAIGKDELSNVCLVITDLTATYAGGSQQIIQALNDLDKETGRSAMSLEPVRMNTDEFYQILRRRIFAELPSREAIADVAQGYAKSVRDARQMDVTNASPEQFAARVTESYPFHPAIRDLYARFKENPGFQQTRGLIRLMRIVTSRLWENGAADRAYLISAHDIDLNDRETLSEINQINSSLENAVSSQKLSGRDYETDELIVSFLAADSTGKHETGEPVTWNNRITIKSRGYGSSEDKRVELRTAPPAPTRYTTDGSDPKVAGGAYDDPFAVPGGSRFVLAVAEDKGIVSDTHKVSVDWGPGPDPVREEPIDPDRPATWRPLSHPEKIFHLSTTHSGYGFSERLKKHGGKAAAQRIAVLDGQWAELTLADEMLLGTDQIHATVEHLRSLVSEGEVSIEASALWFPTGQQILDYVHDIAVELPRIEVEQ